MQIACLGWGSLVWNPGSLPIQGSWQSNGPWLPIEFARQSNNGRITLVCVPGICPVQCLWVLLSSPTVVAAREALRKREGIPEKNAEHDIAVWPSDQASESTVFGESIGNWANTLNLDAVIWTNLPPKFQGKNGYIPTAEEVIAYLSSLAGEKRQTAEQYIRKAPRQIRTPYRTQIEQALGWSPDEQSMYNGCEV